MLLESRKAAEGNRRHLDGWGCSHGRGRWGAAGGPPRVRWDEAGCLRNECDGPHFAGEKIMRK